MLRLVLSVVGGLLLSANAWAIPQAGGNKAPEVKASTLGLQLCLLLQDPWQDCHEEPVPLSTVESDDETLLDPWQDADDPWQPFPTLVPAGTQPETVVDPWQPLITQLEVLPAQVVMPSLVEDPWQPASADPWQEGADDPWQAP